MLFGINNINAQKKQDNIKKEKLTISVKGIKKIEDIKPLSYHKNQYLKQVFKRGKYDKKKLIV